MLIYPEADCRFLPKFKQLSWSEHGWSSFVLSLQSHRAKLSPGADPSVSIKDVITECVKHIIDHIHITFTLQTTYYSHPSAEKSLIQLLNLCHKTSNRALYPRALDRVLGRDQLQLHRKDLPAMLSPLLSSLLTFLNSTGNDPKTPPFSTAITIIVCTFVDTEIGPKPDIPGAEAQIQRYCRVGCTCSDCKAAVEFLTTSPHLSYNWAGIGAQRARHVAAKLAGMSGVTANVVTTRTPYSLSVGIYQFRVCLAQSLL